MKIEFGHKPKNRCWECGAFLVSYILIFDYKDQLFKTHPKLGLCGECVQKIGKELRGLK